MDAAAVKTLLDEKPNDKNIQAVVDRLGKKLETAYGKEKKAEVSTGVKQYMICCS